MVLRPSPPFHGPNSSDENRRLLASTIIGGARMIGRRKLRMGRRPYPSRRRLPRIRRPNRCEAFSSGDFRAPPSRGRCGFLPSGAACSPPGGHKESMRRPPLSPKTSPTVSVERIAPKWNGRRNIEILRRGLSVNYRILQAESGGAPRISSAATLPARNKEATVEPIFGKLNRR